MRRILVCLTLAVLGGFSHPVEAERETRSPSDTTIRTLLVGTWTTRRKQPDGVEAVGMTTYRKNGTFTGNVRLRRGDRNLTMDVTGTWKVQEGVLSTTIATVRPAETLPVGHVSRDRILAISRKEYRYRTERGNVHTYRRVP